jgi:hypothetical protein
MTGSRFIAACCLPLLGLAVWGALPGGQASAAIDSSDRPIILPTRDVDVTYQTTQRGQSMSQRVRWTARDRKLRIDPPGADMYVIIDYDHKRMSMVRDQEHAVIEMAAPQSAIMGLEDRLNGAVRKDTEQVAGLSCTNWETQDMHNVPATACITTDGVMLQAKSRGKVVVTASAVHYGAQDPAAFMVPDGYIHLSADQLPKLALPR